MSLTSLQPHELLVEHLADLPGCLVAFSGGVDSSVVAKAAQLALGNRAVAVTGTSPSFAAGELGAARQVASSIGIRHEVINTDELSRQGYLENQPDRCWHCKTELYERLDQLGRRLGIRTIVNGANLDDRGDYRPGLIAADEHQVRSPLIECGIDKKTVREIARGWDLEVWDRPATPCLSSRVVYGLEITPERLSRIDAAEQALREIGLRDVRVRCHQDDLARLEVAIDDLPVLLEKTTRTWVLEQLQEFGFRYVTIDLEGFRSGSFKQLVPIEDLTRFGI